MRKVEYVVAGHVCRDVDDSAEGGYTTGGTASFSSQMAEALGMHAGVLTSTGPEIDAPSLLPKSHIIDSLAPVCTTFSNIYTPTGRHQIVHSLAGWVDKSLLPSAWKDAAIGHLGPITNQIDPALVSAFGENTLIGITPQGWMRDWDDEGNVYAIRMKKPEALLPFADVVVIGEEDLLDYDQLTDMRNLSKLLVMTRSQDGCIVFQGDDWWDIPAPQVTELNATGAGDIFATAFFVQMHRAGGNIISAAEYANKIASCSVTMPNLETKISAIKQLDSL